MVQQLWFILPVSTFKLGIQKGVLKVEADALSHRGLFRNFRQTKHNPGVNFSKAKLPFES